MFGIGSIFLAHSPNTSRTLFPFVKERRGILEKREVLCPVPTLCTVLSIWTCPLSTHVTNTFPPSIPLAPNRFKSKFTCFPLIASSFGKPPVLERTVPTAPMPTPRRCLNSRAGEKSYPYIQWMEFFQQSLDKFSEALRIIAQQSQRNAVTDPCIHYSIAKGIFWMRKSKAQIPSITYSPYIESRAGRLISHLDCFGRSTMYHNHHFVHADFSSWQPQTFRFFYDMTEQRLKFVGKEKSSTIRTRIANKNKALQLLKAR